MLFHTLALDDAEGCYLAHTHRIASGRVPKGSLLDSVTLGQLRATGIEQVMVAQLEPTDVHEDEAAARIATLFAGAGTRCSPARTGRANLHSIVVGLCTFDRQAVIEANSIDEGITVATLPEDCWVARGRLLATVKIIPFAVPVDRLERVLAQLRNRPLSVHPPIVRTTVLIQTRLPRTAESVLDKTRVVTDARLAQRGMPPPHEQRCAHEVHTLAKLVGEALAGAPQWLLIVGASAISDRRDVIPAAIVAAGGSLERFGIPVDPGNLLMLARVGNTRVIGLPGCARSPADNGLDRVLDRLACGLDVSAAWLNGLAVGGLLKEIVDRPMPRVDAACRRTVGGLVLAAGSSTRTGSLNKLLYRYRQLPLVTHVVRHLNASRVDGVTVVTGHDRSAVEAALDDERVHCCWNRDHASGMASSLVTGISALLEHDAVIVCLADMPRIDASIIDRLVDAFHASPDKTIFIPVHQQRRGNPVLFGKVFFDTLLTLDGDVGAKLLCRTHPQQVCEVAVSSDAIFEDYDTPAQLRQLDG